jgi:hypothetical protein
MLQNWYFGSRNALRPSFYLMRQDPIIDRLHMQMHHNRILRMLDWSVQVSRD